MKIIRKDSKNDEILKVPTFRDFIERFWEEPFLSFSEIEPSLTHKVDISEKGNEILVRADLPGIDSKNINIEVSGDSINISGKIEKSEEEKSENFYRMERRFGEFSREFALPAKVDPEKVQATFKNGVLKISLAKQASSQKKKIEVQEEK